MAMSKVSYENFRMVVMNLLTADGNLLEEDENLLQIISESDHPRAVLDLAREMKDEGNMLFKDGVVDDALEKYGYAGLIATCYAFSEEFRYEVFELTIIILLNSAACFSKKKEFEQVGMICSIILDFNPTQVKALFRRAMAAIELGRNDLAYWDMIDLLKASNIDPENREIQKKLDQLRHDAPRKEKGNKQGCNVPVGLGMGVPDLRKSLKKKQSSRSETVGNMLVENEKVNEKCCALENDVGIKDDIMEKEEVNVDSMIQECESGVSSENSNGNFMEMNYEGGLDPDKKRPPSVSASSVKVMLVEDEAVSSTLKNSNPAEFIYRFTNRRKADSFLSISGRDYQKLRIGRSVQYFNPSAGSFMTVRMIQPQKERPINNEMVGRTSKMDVSTISKHDAIRTRVEEHSMEAESTITHDDQNEDQTLEEEVAENSGIDNPMQVNQLEKEVISVYAQPSTTACKVRCKSCIARKRRKKIAQPHTLYGAGKREARKRAVQASSSNFSFCRFQHTKRKKRIAISWPEGYDGTRKKSRINECQSAARNDLRCVSNSSSVESCNNSSVESCTEMKSNDRSELLTTHEMVSAYSNERFPTPSRSAGICCSLAPNEIKNPVAIPNGEQNAKPECYGVFCLTYDLKKEEETKSWKKMITIAVSGAAGTISNHLLFKLASGVVFGPDQPISLKLLGSEKSFHALEGVAMELEDSLYPLLREVSIGIDPYEVFEDAEWALLIGAKPRGPGMERADLLDINGKIYAEQGKALNAVASRNVKVIVVGNPCNTNALICMKNAPDIPAKNFHALTRLDENRAKCQLALKAGVFYDKVSNMTIWGNHSTTQVPDFLNAKIDGVPVKEVIKDHKWLEEEFTEVVRKRGGVLIQKWGRSSAASTAVSIVDAIKSLITPTPSGDWFSSAVYTNGNPYGIAEDLVFSMPCRSKGDGDYELVKDVIFDDYLRKRIKKSEEELLAEKRCTAHLTGEGIAVCDLPGGDTMLPGEM